MASMTGTGPNGTAPAPAEVEEALAGLGLTSTEQRAYRFLLERGASTPTQVAAATRQSRGRIYETLRLLVERGLAREEPSRPIRYYAASPTEAVRVALAQAERQSALLKSAYGSLARSGAAPAPAGPRAKPTDVTVLHGRSNVLEEIRKLAEAAQRVLHLEGGGRFAERVAAHPELSKALEAAMRRRVRVAVHLPSDSSKTGRARLETLLGPANVHTLPGQLATNLNYVVTDAAALCALPQPDDSSARAGADIGFRAANATFASEFAQRYEAGPLGAPEPAAVAAADVPTAYHDVLQKAQRDVLALDVGAFREPLAPDERAVDVTLQRARERGVELRLLVTSESAPDLRDRRHLWAARLVAWVPSTMVLVDRRDLFQVVREDGARRDATLRHVRDPREVRFYVDLFERLWSDGTPLE